jgi:radical SAM protein with 4Fe4S-binding SPASM domain
MKKKTSQINVLLLANGFEGIVRSIIDFLPLCLNMPIHNLDALLLSNRQNKEKVGISDIEDEINDISRFQRIFIVRGKKWLKQIFLLGNQLKERDYKIVIMSDLGDKQFFLFPFLLLTFPLFILNKKIFFIERDKALKTASLRLLITKIVCALFSKRNINLFFTKLSRYLKLSLSLGMPQTMIIEVSALCNLKCALCPTGTDTLKRDKGLIKQSDYERIITEVGPYLRYLNLYFCGEPLLHNKICEMIQYAKIKKVSTVQLHTNANVDFSEDFIKKLILSGLDLLVISLDGATQEVYARYRRGGILEKGLNFVRMIAEEKKKQNLFYPKLVIQFIIMGHNYTQLEQMKRIVQATGADSLQLKLLNPNMAKVGLKEKEEFLPRQELAGANIRIGRSVDLNQPKMCSLLWDSAVVTWDGLVVPCCADTDATVVLGRLSQDRAFRKVWMSKRYRDFRTKVQQERKSIILCRDCPNT